MSEKKDLSSVVSNITISKDSIAIFQHLLENYLENGKDNFTLYIKNSIKPINTNITILSSITNFILSPSIIIQKLFK